jgi:hypothetical protein
MIMGQLVRYFENLQQNTQLSRVIDHDIIDTINFYSIYNVQNTKSQDSIWADLDRFTLNKYQFFYVPWIPNYISRLKIFSGSDLLSTKFYGCYLARYRYNTNWCGCHIHTGTNDKKEDWNNFSLYVPSDFTLFCPNSDFVDNYNNDFHRNNVRNKTKTKPQQFEIWGIISNDNKCYTVVVERFGTIRENTPYEQNNTLFHSITKASNNEIIRTGKLIPR